MLGLSRMETTSLSGRPQQNLLRALIVICSCSTLRCKFVGGGSEAQEARVREESVIPRYMGDKVAMGGVGAWERRSCLQIRCIVCTSVEGREKLLVPKIDSLWKHAGRRHAVVDAEKIKKGQHFFEGATKEKKKKKKGVQFRVVFSILSHGRPMTDYEDERALLQQLRVPDMPKKHWSVTSGWEIAVCLAEVLSKHTQKMILKDAPILSVSADEVTTIDHESWLLLHAYVLVDFSRISILLGLQRLVDDNGADAVTMAIVAHLLHHGGLDAHSFASKLLSFGADGVSVFQGSRSGVTKQLQCKHARWMIGIYCMAHRTNLAVQPIANLPIVAKVGTLCQRVIPCCGM